ncbi:hypothetical protein [Pedobacter nanyangensis]|uniref:hypothetical protein n=1 Tax=Pedobacter nanyangensis TaxID=1562389 RepID=UPI000DE27248|nr:hypothetical protein [Pedobacter nanyangensis]
MNYPVFIFHELVLRFSYVNRQIGRYISSTIENGECLIRTTSGKISIAQELLEKQYKDPSQISSQQLQELVSAFQAE